ncbi:hypothetical protein HUJ04_001765 [Dendroctonus ponderosae]|uniref:PDZ domain-containing protein n=1 Tax=Dendroctonus ponderosae TaxID=77166 RepID=A0AAR5P5V7_DENPD|nr:hypothetical protein HUJ04_001765 [Dendroctonus ponderosae]
MRLVWLVFLVVLANVNAGHVWLKDLFSPKGLDLGYGVVLKLNDSHKDGKNVPIMERFTLDLKLGDLLGVSVGKPKSDGVELDFYVNKDGNFHEGRGKKDDNSKQMMIQMIIGYKAALAISAMMAVIKLLTLKALIAAKAALMISLLVLILKLKQPHSSEVVEVEQLEYPSPPIIAKDIGPSFQGTAGGYGGGFRGGAGQGGSVQHNYGQEAQSSNMYSDIIYAPSGAGLQANSEQNSPYNAADTEASTQTGIARKGKDIQRKRDTAYFRKMLSGSAANILTVKKYILPA